MNIYKHLFLEELKSCTIQALIHLFINIYIWWNCLSWENQGCRSSLRRFAAGLDLPFLFNYRSFRDAALFPFLNLQNMHCYAMTVDPRLAMRRGVDESVC